MSKVQKILLGIFLAMFIVPEVLWSPVGNFIYELERNTGKPYRQSFLESSSNANTLSTVLFIQTLGLLFSAIYLAICHKNIKHKIVLWMMVLLLLFAAVIVFYLFGFSITLRHFGF